MADADLPTKLRSIARAMATTGVTQYNELDGDQTNAVLAVLDTALAGAEQKPTPQAPIARVTVEDSGIVSWAMYAPGLPAGKHDVYAAPMSEAPSLPASEGRNAEAYRLLNAAEILLRGYGRTVLADEIVAWITGKPQSCDGPESEEMRLLTAFVSVKPGCAYFDRLMREATQFVAREKLSRDRGEGR